MERRIVGFHQDASSDWTADLSCGHARHVRHRPPWHERAWVEDPAARATRIGTSLDCTRCDRRELPEASVELRRTRSFEAGAIPSGLLARHTTKPGVWARICVTSGALSVRLHAPFHETRRLLPDDALIVPPEIEHDVAAAGDVAFFVAFHGRPKA